MWAEELRWLRRASKYKHVLCIVPRDLDIPVLLGYQTLLIYLTPLFFNLSTQDSS